MIKRLLLATVLIPIAAQAGLGKVVQNLGKRFDLLTAKIEVGSKKGGGSSERKRDVDKPVPTDEKKPTKIENQLYDGSDLIVELLVEVSHPEVLNFSASGVDLVPKLSQGYKIPLVVVKFTKAHLEALKIDLTQSKKEVAKKLNVQISRCFPRVTGRWEMYRGDSYSDRFQIIPGKGLIYVYIEPRELSGGKLVSAKDRLVEKLLEIGHIMSASKDPEFDYCMVSYNVSLATNLKDTMYKKLDTLFIEDKYDLIGKTIFSQVRLADRRGEIILSEIVYS